MDRPLKIAAFAVSNRSGSWNRRLLDRTLETVRRVAGEGVEIDLVDLRSLPLPIYDADDQDRNGIPLAATEIHDRLAASDAVIVASPEYNGGYPALFKNTLDWASRVDMFFLHKKYVGVVTTTPGGGGGARGAKHMLDLFENIFVETHEPFTLPKAHEVLSEDGWLDDDAAVRLTTWATEFLAAGRAKAEAVAAEAAG